MNIWLLIGMLNAKIGALASNTKSIVFDSTTNEIVFTMNDGNDTEIRVPLPYPLTPSEIAMIHKLSIDADGDLTFDSKKVNTLFSSVNSNDFIIDTNGELKLKNRTSSGGSGTLGKDITSNLEACGIPSGTTFTQGTSYDDMWERLLVKYYQPTVAFTPGSTNYEIGTVVSSLNLKAVITKKTNNIVSVKFYDGSTLLNTVTSGITTGGTATYTYNCNNDHTNMTLKCVVDDGKSPVTKTSNINFVRKTFYGCKATNVPTSTSGDIRSLGNDILAAKSGNVIAISAPTGTQRITVAVPAPLTIKSITYDQGMNAEYIDLFVKSTINVEGANGYAGVNYNVYEYIPIAAFSQALSFKAYIQ